jgi:hypothetical protein
MRASTKTSVTPTPVSCDLRRAVPQQHLEMPVVRDGRLGVAVAGDEVLHLVALREERGFVPRERRRVAHQRGVHPERGQAVPDEPHRLEQLLADVPPHRREVLAVAAEALQQLPPGLVRDLRDPLAVLGLVEDLGDEVAQEVRIHSRR